MRPYRYARIERSVLLATLAVCGAFLFARPWPERAPAAPLPPATPMHSQHPGVGCDACHSKRVARAVQCAECHNPMQGLALLSPFQDAYFSGGCAACHPVQGALRRTRPGPDLRDAARKLTREWTYRFLTEPWAWNAGRTGTHYLKPEKDPATTVAKARALVTALVGNSDRPAYTPREKDLAGADKLLAACTTCHRLDRLGSKLSRPWLDAFLLSPHTLAIDARHPDPHWSRAEVSKVTDALLAKHDMVFEPRWPVLDRATVDATDRLVEQLLPASNLLTSAQPKKEAALGVKLVEVEGCVGCHAMPGASAVAHTLARDPKKSDDAHLAHFSAQPTEAATFVRMLRAYDKSGYWPKPRLPSAEGGALARQLACASCHSTPMAACAIDHMPHDLGLSDEERASLIGDLARDHVCQDIR